MPNDGCTNCRVDPEWECFTVSGRSKCQLKNFCGDGLTREKEECDSSEGCSDTCKPQKGYYCTISDRKSTCTSKCGDGIRISKYEGCDDGNERSGDGCFEDCSMMELDFVCYSKEDYHSSLP